MYHHCVCQKCPRGISALKGNVSQISLNSLKALKLSKLLPLSLACDYWPVQPEPYIPSSTILFPFSVIAWMLGSWLAMLSWITWCLFRSFLETIRSLPTEKNNSKVRYCSSAWNKKRLLYFLLLLDLQVFPFEAVVSVWTSWNLYHLSELTLLTVVPLVSLYWESSTHYFTKDNK